MDRLIKLITKTINIGVEDEFDAYENRRIQIANVIGLFSSIASFPFAIMFFLTKAYLLGTIATFSVILYGSIIWFNYKNQSITSRFIIIQSSSILVLIASVLMPEGTWMHALFFLIICHPWLLYNVEKNLGIVLFHAFNTLLFFVLVEFHFELFDFLDFLRPAFISEYVNIINLAAFITTFITINVLIGFIITEYTKYGRRLNESLSASQNLVKEKETAQEDLEIANKELKRSLNQLEQLAYASSHDLKMPLRGIVSFSQLLKRRYSDKLDKDGNEYLDYIVKEGKRQYEQIEGLLNYLKADQEEKNITAVNPNDILNDILTSLRGLIEEKEIEIIKQNLPTVQCDASDLEQVFYNLVSNAVKFTHPTRKAKIQISAIEENDFYKFSVKDNGVGFDMEYHEQMFGIFKTLSSEDRQKGSGIGLSICKKIIQNYDGKIWAESKIDVGSAFYFTLPIA